MTAQIPSATSTSMLGRLEANIIAESALIDKETGRVFWEGGSTTLSGSLHPKLSIPGLPHLKATILTTLLIVTVLSFVARWIRGVIEASSSSSSSANVGGGKALCKSVGLFLLQWTLLRTPEFNGSFVLLVILLYIFEAYTCSTRRYLANAITSPHEVEEYIEQLRNESPVVTWKVRCFHYEKPYWLSPIRCAQAGWQALLRKTTTMKPGSNNPPSNAEQEEAPLVDERQNESGPFRRKVISHEATANYSFSSFVDATIAGVWKRQSSITDETAPFMKIILSKILILANEHAKNDYFKQQRNFVASEGMRDRYAEYSTNIEVPSFKRRMLAIRPVQGVPSAKLFRLNTFWMCTLLGLSLPYRIWFARHCDALRVTVVKETYAEQVEKSSSFTKWFTSSKPAPTESLPVVSEESRKTFRQQMQAMALYAPKEDDRALSAGGGNTSFTNTSTDSAFAETEIAINGATSENASASLNTTNATNPMVEIVSNQTNVTSQAPENQPEHANPIVKNQLISNQTNVTSQATQDEPDNVKSIVENQNDQVKADDDANDELTVPPKVIDDNSKKQ